HQRDGQPAEPAVQGWDIASADDDHMITRIRRKPGQELLDGIIRRRLGRYAREWDKGTVVVEEDTTVLRAQIMTTDARGSLFIQQLHGLFSLFLLDLCELVHEIVDPFENIVFL